MNESVKLQLIIEAVNKADKALGEVSQYLKAGQVDTEKLNAKSRDLTATMGRLAASVVSVSAALATIKAGLSYLAEIETATLGIASAYMTGGQYIDATSKKALKADEALKAAQQDSKSIIQELQYANLQTIATLDQLINAYSVTLPVALAKGFNRQQVKDFTVAMVQAAGAIGLPMNQLGEETRALLTGAIDPRNSRIATVLGLRNEDIAQYKGNANGLFDFLMDKLSAYRIAGMEAQKTWAGLFSNTKDIALQALGQGIEPLFEAIKYELTGITNKIVTIDETTKSIKWNPEFLESVASIRSGLTSIVAEFYRLGMLLDKIGGTGTTIAAAWHDMRANMWQGELARAEQSVFPDKKRIEELKKLLQEQQTLADKSRKANDTYRENYMRSEKALQDMVMSEVGWKPVTADIDKKMREAALKGKRISEQTQINAGNPDEGTQQLLRYYRELDKTAPIWQPKPPKEDADTKLTSLKEKWQETLRNMQADEAKAAADDPFLDKLIEIDKQAAASLEKFKGIAGAELEIEKWRETESGKVKLEGQQKQAQEGQAAAEKEWEIQREGEKALEELEKSLSESKATELGKRLLAVDATAKKEKELADTVYESGVSDEAAHQAKIIEINNEAARQKGKINAEYVNQTQEAEINSRLAALDLLEKEGMAHRDTLQERIALTKLSIAAEEQYLQTMTKEGNLQAWNSQQAKVDALKKSVAELTHDVQGSSLTGALTISLKETGNELTDLFGKVNGAVHKAFDGMTEALTDFVMTGKANFSDLANSIIRDMIRIMIQQRITGPLASAAGGWLGSIFNSGSTVSAGALDLPNLTANVAHGGGVMKEINTYRIVPSSSFVNAPRYHGGIGPGERPAIIRTDESVLTPGQMKQLAPVGGGAQQVKVQIINQSGQQMQASDAKVSFNAQEMVVTVFLDALQYNKFGLRTALGG